MWSGWVPGIVPWFFFSESVNSITNCLQEYNYLVKKVVFKVEILPIIKLISCLLVHAFFVVIMFGDVSDYRQDALCHMVPAGVLFPGCLPAGPGNRIFYQRG